jgi:hypothetical protein
MNGPGTSGREYTGKHRRDGGLGAFGPPSWGSRMDPHARPAPDGRPGPGVAPVQGTRPESGSRPEAGQRADAG